MIGGKSMGGRIASLVADEAAVAGLVCLGYPFHPVGKPTQLRTQHLEFIKTPTLILQGQRDPFGGPAEVAGYHLPSTIRLHWLVDGDHSFKPRKSSGTTEAAEPGNGHRRDRHVCATVSTRGKALENHDGPDPVLCRISIVTAERLQSGQASGKLVERGDRLANEPSGVLGMKKQIGFAALLVLAVGDPPWRSRNDRPPRNRAERLLSH